MRKFFQLFLGLSLMLLLLPPAVQAQERVVTGTIVSDDNKTPLSGVTIRVKGTRRIVQTDAAGKFSVRVNPGETLQVSYVGYESEDIKPGDAGNVGISLKATDNTMNEVVVTAMDQRRNSRELGYSVQKLDGNELKESQRENFLNSMQGRVAGLTINPTSGMAGASSQIVLRGFNSIALDNSPLFVIDGVIVDNQTLVENHGGGGAGTNMGLASARENRTNDYSNRIGDINPNDIETITVLKGPEATALYGSQASSGAIIITTKKSNTNGKLTVNYDNSFRVSKLTHFPRTQNLFSTGTNGIAGATLSSTSGTYFGPAYPANTQFYDNVENFYQSGFAQTHNLSTEFGKKDYTVRFSGSFLDQKSPIPTNTYKRYNARLSGTVKLGKYIDIIPSISYIRTVNDKPLRGLAGYLLTLMVWPADEDVLDWKTPDGLKKTVFAANPNAELDNPLFNVYRNRSHDETNRVIGTMGINFNPFDWLSISGRFGYDTYRTEGYIVNHPYSFYLTRTQGGSLDNYYRNYYGYNHTITATVKKKLGKDLNARLVVGNMWQDYETQMYAVFGTNLIDSVGLDGLMYKGNNGVPALFTQAQWDAMVGSNPDSALTRISSRQRLLNAIRKMEYNKSINRQAAYFGEVSLSWRNMVFLTYSHRFEESSIFPKQFRKYNYPAASLSMLLSDMFPVIKKGVINYLKLRGSLANTARSSSPYANQPVFAFNFGSGGGYFYGFNNGNPLLQPERQRTFEVGTEWRLFKSKLSLDFTYYNTKNNDLIGELVRFSYGTGYVLNTINIGSSKNTGIEVSIEATPVKTTNFRWTTRINFNRMRNEMLSLPANVPEYYNSDTWLYGNARGGLRVGYPTTTITGLGYLRNTKGDILIDPATGVPIPGAPTPATPFFNILGDRNPNFTTGFLNSFSYKNFKLSFLWDLKVGGDIFNATDMYLTLQGKSVRSGDRLKPRVVTGVLRDGLENSSTPTQNTIALTPYYAQTYYTTMPEAEFIEKDVNWFRLRDLTLSYTFADRFLNNAKFIKTLSVFFTGTDLILMTNYSGGDPAVNGNTTATRGVGAFGFDYGNTGAPVGLNFGIKASF
ncbi:MAG: SusC/RagA family TonB-linked outer membrane protein [Ferruginibacter sp.]|nr:SusC/RagA family TonB-linked outer membrane protein [Chitinophagaceae bacterium]